MNDIEAAFGDYTEQVEQPPAETSRETQLTELHQVKADALATVRPLKELTVETHGLKRVTEGRKAVVKLRTSIDKRRKLLNEEAKKWIDTVNGVAKEISTIIEPVELHLKHQEALYEEQQRQAAEAERVERVTVRRMSWPENAGVFPESEAGSLMALEWTSFVFERVKAESTRRQEEQQRAAERAELEELRRAKAESDRREAEALAEKHVEEETARQVELVLQQLTDAEKDRLARISKMWDDHAAELPQTEAAIDADILPLNRRVERVREFVIRSSDYRLARFEELKAALYELLRMQGDAVDWRGMVREALEDATT